MKWMIPITFFCWILACGEPEAPGPQPNVEQFFAVYQDFLNMSQSDSLAFQNEQDLLDSALARHNMQPEEFDATLEYLETLGPLVARGGYIPFCDHRCPPNVPQDDYLYYLDLKREMFGMR